MLCLDKARADVSNVAVACNGICNNLETLVYLANYVADLGSAMNKVVEARVGKRINK